MTIRTTQVGFHKNSKSYVTAAGAIKAVEIAGEKLGMFNVLVVQQDGRYFPVCSCFSNPQDSITLARKGFNVFR